MELDVLEHYVNDEGEGGRERAERAAELLNSRLLTPATSRDEREAVEQIANLMAIAPADVWVAHRTAAQGVDPLTERHITDALATARWVLDARAELSLEAEVGHPVLAVFLHERAAAISDALAEAAQKFDALRSLPLRANAAGVVASPDEDGRPSFIAAGAKFHLAEDRIRELLMGENLYGDSSLAIRELYQNAVDACRHRNARLEYLARGRERAPGQTQATEAAEIEFTEGVTSTGDRFIERVDHGVGMGLEELTRAFCQAGVRSADLDEYKLEQADFARSDPPVELWTNSRFGIGALSYFMLAERLDITTTRLNRDGSLGETLEVSIPGPEQYFRIREVQGSGRSGTRVRLTLRPGASVSALSTLRDLVIVSPFHVTASDSVVGTHEWQPGVVNRASTRATISGDVYGRADQNVWWVDGWGTILADGIWVKMESMLYGAIVNLTGSQMPRLTADRLRVVAIDHRVIGDLMRAAIPMALSECHDIVTSPRWLTGIVQGAESAIADEILAAATETSPLSREYSGLNVDLLASGYAPNDEDVVDPGASHEGSQFESWRVSSLLAACSDSTWLRSSGIDVSAWPAVVAALPTDSLLMGQRDSSLLDGSYLRNGVWPALSLQVLQANRQTNAPVAAITARLRTLGYSVPLEADALPPADEFLCRILDLVDDRRPHEASSMPDPVKPWEIYLAARLARIPFADGVDALRLIGVPLADSVSDFLSHPPTVVELAAASLNGSGEAPWRNTADRVTVGDLRHLAGRTGVSAGTIAAALRRLGFTNQAVQLEPGTVLTESDDIITSRRSTRSWRFLDRSEVVSLWHVLTAANEIGESPGYVTDRLRMFGYRVAEMPPGQISEERAQVTLVDPTLPDAVPLDQSRTVPPAHVVLAARELRLPIDDVCKALRECGYRLVDDSRAYKLDGDDLVVASADCDGDFPLRAHGSQLQASDIVCAAVATGLTIDEVESRAAKLGFVISSRPALPRGLRRKHLLVFDEAPPRNGDDPVSVATVIALSRKLSVPVSRVVSLFNQMGFTAPDPALVLPVVCPGPAGLASSDAGSGGLGAEPGDAAGGGGAGSAHGDLG